MTARRTIERARRLRERGWLTQRELIKALADRGIFLGRSPQRTIAYWRSLEILPAPIKALGPTGRGSVGYYPPATIEKAVNYATRRVGKRSATEIIADADKEGALLEKMLTDTAKQARRMKPGPERTELAGLVAACLPHGYFFEAPRWANESLFWAWALLGEIAEARDAMLGGNLEAAFAILVRIARDAENVRTELEAKYRKQK